MPQLPGYRNMSLLRRPATAGVLDYSIVPVCLYVSLLWGNIDHVHRIRGICAGEYAEIQPLQLL